MVKIKIYDYGSESRRQKAEHLNACRSAGLPLIHAIAERMRLKEILYKYMPAHGNEEIPAV